MATAPTSELGHGSASLIPGWNQFGGGDNDVTQLAWPTSVTTYHRMRTDSQVDALLTSVFLPIRRLNWEIQQGEASDEVAQAVAADLGLPLQGEKTPKRSRKRFSHDDHLRHALLATTYGHMFFEQVGRVDDDLMWRLRKLAPRMPQSITEIKVAKDGGLEYIKQHDPKHGMQGAKIPIERLVAYVWDREGANWTGRSLLRPLYRHWLLKDRLIRIDAIKHERFGVGIPTGKAPPGGNPDEYQQMAAAIRASESSGVGLPAGAEIGVEGIKGSIPDVIASLRYHDEQMARSFLAMFMQLGQTATGSRALGDSFRDFFELSLEAIANWYAEVTNQHVIEDWVDWNFGEDEPAPELVWSKAEASDLSVQDIVTLIDKEILVVDEELQDWIRERHHLPPPGLLPEADDVSSSVDDDEPLEDWARDAAGLPPATSDELAVAARSPRRVAAHLPGQHDQRTHAKGGAHAAYASTEEHAASQLLAEAKIAAAPVPSKADIKKARADLKNAKRPGGDSRGGSADARLKQRKNLYAEWGGDEKGYIVCPGTGLKMHWADPNYKGKKYDPKAENPNGYPAFERGKIFVKRQGGSYKLSNLVPESYELNRVRGNALVRPENA